MNEPFHFGSASSSAALILTLAINTGSCSDRGETGGLRNGPVSGVDPKGPGELPAGTGGAGGQGEPAAGSADPAKAPVDPCTQDMYYCYYAKKGIPDRCEHVFKSETCSQCVCDKCNAPFQDDHFPDPADTSKKLVMTGLASICFSDPKCTKPPLCAERTGCTTSTCYDKTNCGTEIMEGLPISQGIAWPLGYCISARCDVECSKALPRDGGSSDANVHDAQSDASIKDAARDHQP